MNDDAVKALAQRLAEARLAHKTVDFIGGLQPPDNERDAYCIQFALHDELTKGRRDTMAGWKVAAAVPAQYEALGLTGPALAGILKSGLVKSPAHFAPGYPLKAGVECEMAVRMASDAPASAGPYTAANILPLIGAVMPAMEVVDNRYANLPEMKGPARVADDFLQAACVLGREITDFRSIDFMMMHGKTTFEGKELGAGPGSNVMGSPIISLAWLANKLIALGTNLKAGDIVMTGSVHAPQFLPGAGTATAGWDKLGEVSARFG
ncbi:MAG: fumarylacetoacetate hydrolase family protein [Rhodospirillales bacterium]